MGAIAKYTRPGGFEELVAAVRAFILIDLRLTVDADYRVHGDKVPHHRFSIDECGAGVDIVDNDGLPKFLTGDEIELLDIVRGTGLHSPAKMTAGQACDILLAAAKGVGRA